MDYPKSNKMCVTKIIIKANRKMKNYPGVKSQKFTYYLIEL